MIIEWKKRRPGTTDIHVADLSPFPVELQVWLETEDNRWFATIDIPTLRGPYFPVESGGRGFDTEQQAKDAAVAALKARMEKIITAFVGGLVFQ